MVFQRVNSALSGIASQALAVGDAAGRMAVNGANTGMAVVATTATATKNGIETMVATTAKAGIRARHGVSNLLPDLAYHLTRPIEEQRRNVMAIAGEVLTQAGTISIVSAVFPPAVPLMTGLALIEALPRAKLLVQQNKREMDQERQEQLTARRAALSADLARWETGQVSIETPLIAAVVDIENGNADGVVLSGQFSGRSISSLSREECGLLEDLADEASASLLETLVNTVASWGE
jgi:hypothetical protein